MTRQYAGPAAFKQALEARLLRHARDTSTNVARIRQRCVFERFVARLANHFGNRVIVKGGFALQIRLEEARMTGDVDVRLAAAPASVLLELRKAGQAPLDADYFAFTVEPHPRHPTIEAEGMIYGGQRFRVEATLAGKIYGSRFGLDVAFGDRMAHPPDLLVCSDLFAFAGIPRLQIHGYAREVHLAEKVHAMTQQRPRENSRVRDLPDIVLLATTGPFDSSKVREAIRSTFDYRSAPPPPEMLPSPPESWRDQYAEMARENRLRWTCLDEVLAAARAFLDPVLRGDDGVWDPETWTWRGEG